MEAHLISPWYKVTNTTGSFDRRTQTSLLHPEMYGASKSLRLDMILSWPEHLFGDGISYVEIYLIKNGEWHFITDIDTEIEFSTNKDNNNNN